MNIDNYSNRNKAYNGGALLYYLQYISNSSIPKNFKWTKPTFVLVDFKPSTFHNKQYGYIYSC